jgi:murein L,D-transpeptidase YcbB/YkuD
MSPSCAQRLAITEDLPAEVADGDAYDTMLTEAVKRFQARHGLPETGTVGPADHRGVERAGEDPHPPALASLDRLYGMNFTVRPALRGGEHSAAVAEAVEDGKVARRYVAVVGKVDRPSPTLTTTITAVNLNPTWTVPLSILKKDIVTKMRKDPGYVGRMKMRVLDSAGNEVDARAVDWQSDRTPNFTVRQDSGAGNALGNMRIDMPNPHSVYMHDTNHKEFFSADYRFQSSGCTRVRDVQDLAA